jgi:Lrp/AsnC family transcriptional regulator, leucine-responsive regulatory protein
MTTGCAASVLASMTLRAPMGFASSPFHGERRDVPRIRWHHRRMAVVPLTELDATDARLLAALRDDGRRSIAELGRRVSMSASASLLAERVRRLEDAGVITGYRAVVDPGRFGDGILASLRLRHPSSVHGPLHGLPAATREVIEAHHVTGDDCFVLKVMATSMGHLEQVSGRITTSVAHSSPVPPRPIRPAG